MPEKRYGLKGLRRVVQAGDHVVAERSWGLVPYEHHGIYIGNGVIIHLADEKVRKVTLKDFSGDHDDMWIKDYGDLTYFGRQHIVDRARFMLGTMGYNLNDMNCEHFASFCVTGESISEQVGIFWTAVAAIGAIAATAAVVVLAPVALPIGAGTAALLSGATGVAGLTGVAVTSDMAKVGRGFD
jgi:hypothetical protein